METAAAAGASGPRGRPEFKHCLSETSPWSSSYDFDAHDAGGPVLIPGQRTGCHVLQLSVHTPQPKESEDLTGCSEARSGQTHTHTHTHTHTRVFLEVAFSKKDTTWTLAKFD